MGPITRAFMADVARRQLRSSRTYRPVTEDEITVLDTGDRREDQRIRELFAGMNRDSNEALRMFWRDRLERYTK